MINTRKDWRIATGLILCVCGISVGGLIKVLTGVNTSMISMLIAAISTFLLIDLGDHNRYFLIDKQACSVIVSVYSCAQNL